MLNSVVYRGTNRWNNFSSFRRFFLAFLYTLIMPLCMMGYMLTPSNGVTEKLEFPLYKLLSHVSSMIWLLVLVTLSAFEDKFNHNLHVSPLSMSFKEKNIVLSFVKHITSISAQAIQWIFLCVKAQCHAISFIRKCRCWNGESSIRFFDQYLPPDVF